MKGMKPRIISCVKDYSRETFMKDLMAGIIVGIVALPLAIAFGIASGVTPEKGIITAIVAGFLISLLGGTKVQIGGPTGAFIVIIYGIVNNPEYGLQDPYIRILSKLVSSRRKSSIPMSSAVKPRHLHSSWILPLLRR